MAIHIFEQQQQHTVYRKRKQVFVLLLSLSLSLSRARRKWPFDWMRWRMGFFHYSVQSNKYSLPWLMKLDFFFCCCYSFVCVRSSMLFLYFVLAYVRIVLNCTRIDCVWNIIFRFFFCWGKLPIIAGYIELMLLLLLLSPVLCWWVVSFRFWSSTSFYQSIDGFFLCDSIVCKEINDSLRFPNNCPSSNNTKKNLLFASFLIYSVRY